MKKNSGFTLIEILVVVTIIALLTATAAVSYSQFSKQSRDAKRKTDIEQIRAALEMYRSNVDSYPLVTVSLTLPPVIYIQSIPSDPKTNLVYPFFPLPAGCDGTSSNPCNDYSITASLESGETYTAGPYGAVVSSPTSTPAPPPPPLPTLTPTPTPADG